MRLVRSQTRAKAIYACKHILGEVNKLLTANRVSELSNGEPTYVTFCELLSRVFDLLLAHCNTPAEAEEAVTPVHDAFMLALLAKRNFNGMLTLVRETERSLQRHKKAAIAAHGPEAPPEMLAPRLAWLQEHKVVEELLNVNMHQRQYTEGMQKLLEVLAELNALDKETLVSLWAKQRQVPPYDREFLAAACVPCPCTSPAAVGRLPCC